MIWERRRHWSRIGIDVGPRSIRAAQLHRTSRGWRLAATGRFGRSGGEAGPDAAEVERLRDALDRLGFRGREVVLSVPESKVLTAALELPPRSSGAPLEQLARMEVARAHRREPNGLELACWEVPSPNRAGQTTHMMAAACAHADADPLLDAFEAGGLAVGALDVRVLAMARAAERTLAGAQGLSAVLDVGEEAAVLAVIGEGSVVFERTVEEAGITRLRASLRSQFGLEPEVTDHVLGRIGCTGLIPDEMGQWDSLDEAIELISDHAALIGRETGASLSYVTHRYEGMDFERLLVAGEGAAWPGLPERLGKLLAIPTTTLAPGDVAEIVGADPAAGDPALTVAVGLAMNEE